jgi:UDP-N-acetylglucosamine 2-epimerase (non-hydrolysing)
MSAAFFEQLGLPDPDEFLNVGSGSHAQQTAKIMAAFEPVLLRHKPDWVLVVGDVNSTVACALVAAKLNFRVAHIEAGLRSRDRNMPEEINRIVTDHLSDLLFTPSADANSNLMEEGIDPDRIRFVGNVMIDSLVRMVPRIPCRRILDELELKPREFALVTMHRPGNVDLSDSLKRLLSSIVELSNDLPVVFPVHPRTRQRIEDERFGPFPPALRLLEPLDYARFVALMSSARLVVTDSGGVQEETTFLGVQCLTVRPNTERPITISCGTNRLLPDIGELVPAARETMSRPLKVRTLPDLWDGKAASRIVRAIAEVNGKTVGANVLSSVATS